jgi:hypothetical protein
MNENFLNDLDDYFAIMFDDYNLISSLKSYTDDKRDYLINVYTSNSVKYNFKPNENKYKICFHQNKKVLLNELKNQLIDNHFEFSYSDISFKNRIKSFFIKEKQFGLFLRKYLLKYGFTDYINFYKHISINTKVWHNILKSRIIPSKRLIFKICLYLGTNIEDNLALLKNSGYSYNYKIVLDVIVRYLIEKNTFNKDLIELAFKEYKLKPIF